MENTHSQAVKFPSILKLNIISQYWDSKMLMPMFKFISLQFLITGIKHFIIFANKGTSQKIFNELNIKCSK